MDQRDSTCGCQAVGIGEVGVSKLERPPLADFSPLKFGSNGLMDLAFIHPLGSEKTTLTALEVGLI